MLKITGKFYEVGVKLDKTQEDGRVKKVKETYAVDGLTFSEGEKNTIEEMAQYISGEFEVVKMRPMKVAEIVRDESGSCRFWKAKVVYTTIDEVSGKEKKMSVLDIVEGEDFESALMLFNEYMKSVIGDWELVGLTLTAILDVFEYKAKE